MKANKPCSGHLVDRGGYYHTVIYVLENGKRKPVSRTTGLPVKNNLRKAQKILEDRKREYDEMGLAGMLSLEERDRFASMPLADYMRYVFDHKPNLTAPTKIGYLNTINGRIDKFFGPRGVTISSITPKHIEDFIEYLAEDGLCGTTQHDYVKLIGTCLRYAVRKDHILRNPMDKVDMPKKSKSHAQFYTQQEAEKLLEAARGTEIYIPVLLATFYGLRRSEVCGVQWDSIDWENDQIHIDHKVYEDSLQEGNPIVITDQMKTESSRRTLPLIPYVKEELLRHKNYYHTDSGAMLSQSNGKHQGDDDTAAIRKKYEKYFSHWPDVLSIPQVSQMTGYSITSVRKWCSKKRMKSFMINQCYMIPKEYLLDYLSKKHYLRFVIKAQVHSSHTSLSENTENISEKQ